MTLLQALLLGLIQGLTEFLPVSSSGHLAITQHFMPGFSQPGVLFDVMLHLGTMVAVVIYFRQDLRRLLFSPLPGGSRDARSWSPEPCCSSRSACAVPGRKGGWRRS